MKGIKINSLPAKIVISSAYVFSVLNFSNQAQAFSVNVHADITKTQLRKIQGRAGNGVIFKWDERALQHIANENKAVDNIQDGSMALTSPERHFTNERFPEASQRLIDLRKRIIEHARDSSASKMNSVLVREDLGRALHTIQDFYSHGTWVELGNLEPNHSLGLSLLAKPAATVQPCIGNPNAVSPGAGGAVSSSYFVGVGTRDQTGCVTTLLPENKCFHGNYTTACTGINKDLSAQDARDEGVNQNPLHNRARALAEAATTEFVQGIVDELGNDYDALRVFFNVRASFVAVIDHTTSMSSGITGVKSLVGQMVSAVSQDPSLAPEGYVLVSYGDPDIDPAIITVDPTKFLAAINNISLHGGGTDCPELTTAGIIAAADAASYGSELWVFTDATSKDRDKLGALSALAKSKGLKINYALTGSCSPTDPGYIRIADETGGRVVRISPSQIPLLSELVIPEMTGTRNTIFNVSRNATSGTPQVIALPVETGMKEMTVSLSVPENNVPASHSVTIITPSGVPLNPSTGVTISKFNGNYIARVTLPEPGLWSVKIEGYGPFTVQGNGTSPINFSGFNFVEANGDIHGGFFPYDGLPASGKEAIASANIFGAISDITFSTIDSTGSAISSLPLFKNSPLSDRDEYIGFITPPAVPFRILASGHDTSGRPFSKVYPAEFIGKGLVIERLGYESLSSPPGSTVNIGYTLTNLGSSGNFTISAKTDLNYQTIISPSNVAIESGKKINFSAQVVIPEVANEFDSTKMIVTATRASDINDYNSISNTITVAGINYSGLVNKQPVAGLAGLTGDKLLYRVVIPEGVPILSLMAYGGKGDISLYAARGRQPNPQDFDSKSTRPGNSETVRFSPPQAGEYYLLVTGVTDFSGVTIVARW